MNERDRRISRPWRIAFIMYACALAIGTHWPQLQLPDQSPVSDKTIHLIAFGGLALLLWHTRWVANLPMLALITAAWAVIDELTQGFPLLNRHVSRYDLIANILGVVIAIAWIAAMKPVGVPGGINRMRLRVHTFVYQELFAERRPWIAAAIILAPLAIFFYVASRFGLSHREMRRLVLAATFPSMFLVGWQWIRLWGIKQQQLRTERRCLACGEMQLPGQDDDECRSCSERAQTSAWVLASPPSSRMRLHIAQRPLLIAVISLLAGFALIIAWTLMYGFMLNQHTGTWAIRVTRILGTLPREFTNAVDLSIYLLVFAFVTYMYRKGLARFYDRATICLQCGHDLRGTPVNEQAIGRCGECGAEFART